MSKIIWIDNLLLFKIIKVYTTQYLCICSQQYKNDLDMDIGDIVFLKDRIKSTSYGRLGEILAFNDKKIIVSVMGDIGTGSKSKMEKLHMKSLNQGVSEDEIENDEILYGGKKKYSKL